MESWKVVYQTMNFTSKNEQVLWYNISQQKPALSLTIKLLKQNIHICTQRGMEPTSGYFQSLDCAVTEITNNYKAVIAQHLRI